MRRINHVYTHLVTHSMSLLRLLVTGGPCEAHHVVPPQSSMAALHSGVAPMTALLR
jgi:hypothetical protein